MNFDDLFLVPPFTRFLHLSVKGIKIENSINWQTMDAMMMDSTKGNNNSSPLTRNSFINQKSNEAEEGKKSFINNPEEL
jgi:hypothetical protein